jgi:hypothetical protein
MKGNELNSVEVSRPRSNVIDLTHDVKMSSKMGNLDPCLVMEVVPGDRVSIGADLLVRMAPMIAPVMHRFDVTVHYWFVPNRILWDSWEEFIFNRDITHPAPYITIDDSLGGDIPMFLSKFGIPLFTPGNTPANINALPFAAYQKIWNDCYRDENLQPEVSWELVDGDNSSNGDMYQPRYRSWEHDYFTSALPFAQKGTAVDVPLGDVVLKDDWHDVNNPLIVDSSGTGLPAGDVTTGASGRLTLTTLVQTEAAYDPNGTLEVGSTTINTLRTAFRIQEWLEKNARGGNRYIEGVLMHFGVRSSDKRMQRPEFIAGVKSPVIVSEVLNTAGVDSLPQGNMAGHGVGVSDGRVGSMFIEEHGFVIGIVNMRPKSAYQQGIHRQFLRLDPLDYYWPSFAHLGEQGIMNQEIYAYTPTAEGIFGYIPRYAEYRHLPSRVAGDFMNTLNFWHAGRIFGSQPALNAAFIKMVDDDVARIFAVTDDVDHIYYHILHKIRAVRPMPLFGTPMM